jgi:hypothetical protein
MDERYLNRLRFSFAHELGHYFLHEYIYNKMLFSHIEEWRDFLKIFQILIIKILSGRQMNLLDGFLFLEKHWPVRLN